MYKQIIIIVIVFFLILLGDILTQENTKKIVEDISDKLYVLRESMINKDKKSDQQMKDVFELWDEEYNRLAFYIEHNELEKVETELTKLRADIEVEEYNTGVENLDNCIFILNHIKEKNLLKIVNVF